MAWPLVDIVVEADRTHLPPPSPIPRPFPGRIASTRSSHPRLGPALGHTGGDQAGATTIVTKRTTTSNQPIYQLEVLIRRFNFLSISFNLIIFLGAARPFASSASNRNNGEEMSSGTATHALRIPFLRPTRNPARYLCSTEVRLSLFSFTFSC